MDAAENSEIEGDVFSSVAEDLVINGARESLTEEKLAVVRRGNEEMSLDDSDWKCIGGLGKEMDRFLGDGSRKLDMGARKAVACSLHKFPCTVRSAKCACTRAGCPNINEVEVYELVESDVEMFELLGSDIIASEAEHTLKRSLRRLEPVMMV